MLKISNLIVKTIAAINLSHKSNEMKEYEIQKLIDNEDDGDLKLTIRKIWKKFNEPKVIAHNEVISNKWKNCKLQVDNKGNIMTNRPTNLYVILTEHPSFKNKLSFNELTYQYCYNGKEIHDVDYTRLRIDICDELQLSFSKLDIIDQAELVAKNNPFHPIRDYFNSIKWDNKNRIPELLKFLQIEQTELNVSVITSWLIAAVARIMKPGCKVDSIPVFQGMTGNRKSSALKALMPNEEWFCDEPVDFGTKDAKQMLLGKWFVELAELSSFNKKCNNLIKSDITHTVDEFRSPYDRKPKKYPRQFVYIGTTNDLEFLTDSTSNRRFHILQNLGLIDVDQIKIIRDQLWAQAFALFQSGKEWWLNRSQEKEMSEFAQEFEVKDIWYDKIALYLLNKDYVSTSDVLDFVKIDNENKLSSKDRSRIIKIMQFMRWNNTIIRKDGELIRVWKKPSSIEGKELPLPTSDWS